jgi:DNA-binding transcriptional LysR family regulator
MPTTSPPVRRRRRPRITLDQLHTFLAVAEREHVTEAADALGLSQGSVSALVHRLEETLGLPLFHRVGRNVRLTDVGRALRQLAPRVLEEAAQIEDLSTGYLAFERGELAIACGRATGTHRLATWLAPFAREHPDIEVQLTLAPMQALLEMLVSGSVDVIVAGSQMRAPEVESLVLERSDMVIVVAATHPLATSTAPMRELQRYRYLAHEGGTATEMQAVRVLGSKVQRASTIELEEGALLAALLAGLGYAVMPRAVVERELEAGDLAVVPHGGRRVSQVFTAARRRGIQTPAVQAFWGHLERIAARQ